MLAAVLGSRTVEMVATRSLRIHGRMASGLAKVGREETGVGTMHGGGHCPLYTSVTVYPQRRFAASWVLW